MHGVCKGGLKLKQSWLELEGNSLTWIAMMETNMKENDATGIYEWIAVTQQGPVTQREIGATQSVVAYIREENWVEIVGVMEKVSAVAR